MLILRAFGAVPSSFTEPVTEPAVAASTGVAAGAAVGAGVLSDDSSFLPQLTSRAASNAADTTAKPSRAFMGSTFLIFYGFVSERPAFRAGLVVVTSYSRRPRRLPREYGQAASVALPESTGTYSVPEDRHGPSHIHGNSPGAARRKPSGHFRDGTDRTA